MQTRRRDSETTRRAPGHGDIARAFQVRIASARTDSRFRVVSSERPERGRQHAVPDLLSLVWIQLHRWISCACYWLRPAANAFRGEATPVFGATYYSVARHSEEDCRTRSDMYKYGFLRIRNVLHQPLLHPPRVLPPCPLPYPDSSALCSWSRLRRWRRPRAWPGRTKTWRRTHPKHAGGMRGVSSCSR